MFDPLDGSSNIDAAISTGTIFGIFLENEQCLIDPEGDISEQQQKCLINTLQVGSKTQSMEAGGGERIYITSHQVWKG